MLKPRQNKLIHVFFSWYINRIICSDFRRFTFNRIDFDSEKAILLLANHFSWWDGFVLFQLNRLHFHKKFHIMITEENYHKVWFLKYLGSFSVKKSSRSMMETLEYAGSLLNNPQNLVLIFPQGKLYSNHIEIIHFQKGLINLIKASKQNFQYFFAATFTDYFEHQKPSANCYLQEWKGPEYPSLQLIKDAYNEHYDASRQQQAQITV